ncbi:MAG: universal stress protein [Flavobacteriales bacterium]
MDSLPPLQKILVPTDLSDLSMHALEWADRIADRSDGEIHALKILEPPGEMLFDPEGDLLEVEEYDMGQLELERKNDEEGIAKWASQARNPVITNVQVGRAVEDTLRYVHENGIELIVMGTHGMQGTWEWLAGSVAEKMVRYSNAPVLSIKNRPREDPIDRILLASDLEDPEERGSKGAIEEQVKAASSEYELPGSELQSIGVLKTLRRLFEADLYLLTVRGEKEDPKALEEGMERFIKTNELEDVQKHVEVNEDVEEGILNFVQARGIDLIAIGSHGFNGWKKLFHHSVSEDIVEHLPFPVLTYRIGEGA